MISVQVYSSAVFNTKSAEFIAWEARLRHLEGFIRNFRKMKEETEEEEDGSGKASWAVAAIAEAIFDMT